MKKTYKKIVVISRSLIGNEEIMNSFKEHSEEVIAIASSSTEDETIKIIGDADALVAGLPPLSRRVLESCPNIKVISNYGVGLDNIDLLAAKEKGIQIGWKKGVNKSSVAEIVLARAIDLLRGLSFSHHDLTKGQWTNPRGKELKQIKLGVLGFGEIGKEVGRLFRFMGSEVLTYDIKPDLTFAEEHGIQISPSIEELLCDVDILTCHLPFTKKTKEILNKTNMCLMKEGSYLINTSRGGIVCEKGLDELLKNRHLAGAALDVFEHEPLSIKSPLLKLPIFLGSAHISGTSQAGSQAMAEASFEGLKDPSSIDDLLAENPWLKDGF